ncbi:MAG TPA: outer membrane beta-barrel protein [Vicinamibacterales bacterium]|nr:outer membrane beta-barrel protein [Vicinamibacterales bacterium]
MRPALGFAVLLAIGVLAAPSPARADGFISPTIGVNFGGQAGGTLVNAVNNSNKVSWGVAAGWMGAGILGFEEDFSDSPNFFGSGGAIDSSRAITLMTNAIVGIPIGGQSGAGIRPYGAIGVGWINQNISTVSGVGNFSENDFGWDIGVGVMGYFADHIGLRVDYRYFRNFQQTNVNSIGIESGHFNFNRGSVGVLFRF